MVDSAQDFSDDYSARGVLCPRCVFVGDLPTDASEGDLALAFACIGEPVQVAIKRSKTNKLSLGYGFVEFHTEEEATRAVESEQISVRGRAAKISWAYRNCTLHVSNILSTVLEKDLNSEFSKFGELYTDETTIFRPGNVAHICSIIRLTNSYTVEGRVLCFGRVHFKSRENAETAKESMHGVEFMDTHIPLHVDWYQPPSARRLVALPSRMGPYRGKAYPPIISIYVQFESQNPSARVKDEHLLRVFSQFGNVTLVCIKTSTVVGMVETGYAFIHYNATEEGKNAAKHAVECSPIVDANGCVYNAELSRNFEKSTLIQKTNSGRGGFKYPKQGAHFEGGGSYQMHPYSYRDPYQAGYGFPMFDYSNGGTYDAYAMGYRPYYNQQYMYPDQQQYLPYTFDNGEMFVGGYPGSAEAYTHHG